MQKEGKEGVARSRLCAHTPALGPKVVFAVSQMHDGRCAR